jgi:glycogen synthase
MREASVFPDIIHCNDWQKWFNALLPETVLKNDPQFAKPPDFSYS